MGGLGFYSVWLMMLCLLGIFALAGTPLFAAADAPPASSANTTGNRLLNMDGLRGFLALAVVFHHTGIYHRYLQDGVWGEMPSTIFNLLGPFGVRIFFMITGFLFWSQLLRAQGRPSWLRLYVGRLFRIGPLALASAFAVLAIVAVRTGPHLHESLHHLISHIIRLCSLGFFRLADVNAYPGTFLLLAGVTWTLQWEWYFYFSLPVFALFARTRGVDLAFVLLALVLCQWGMLHGPAPLRTAFDLYRLFLLGMLSGSLLRKGWLIRLPDWLVSGLFLLLLVGFFYFPQGPLLSNLLLGAMFYLIVCGCTLFGVFTSKPARRLGDISYGIYLLQGLPLAAVFRLHALRAPETASPAVHWLMSFTAAVLLVALATAAHSFVELPGIAAGKRAAAALARLRRSPAEARG